jgi:Holliday junction resolvase RusA-like endonuclease
VIFNFKINYPPIAKKRARSSSKTGRHYNVQKKEEAFYKLIIKKQLAEKMIEKPLDGPISMECNFYTPIPKSLSKKKYLAQIGKPDTTRPDVDNFLKFALDCMNGILYIDDAVVTHAECRKIYSDNPRVEFKVTVSSGDTMVNEHAKTVKNEISIEDLDYMVKKANKIGFSGRTIIRVFMQEDIEGKHYYFECEGLSTTREKCDKYLEQQEKNKVGHE